MHVSACTYYSDWLWFWAMPEVLHSVVDNVYNTLIVYVMELYGAINYRVSIISYNSYRQYYKDNI